MTIPVIPSASLLAFVTVTLWLELSPIISGETERCRGQAELAWQEARSCESYGLRRTQVARVIIEAQ